MSERFQGAARAGKACIVTNRQRGFDQQYHYTIAGAFKESHAQIPLGNATLFIFTKMHYAFRKDVNSCH